MMVMSSGCVDDDDDGADDDGDDGDGADASLGAGVGRAVRKSLMA